MGEVKHIKSTEEFNEFLKEAGDKLVVVDFFADWCGPCKKIAPEVVTLSQEKTNVLFCKVDVDDFDEDDDPPTKYKIEAMPTFVFFKNGNEVERMVGANVNTLKEKIANNE